MTSESCLNNIIMPTSSSSGGTGSWSDCNSPNVCCTTTAAPICTRRGDTQNCICTGNVNNSCAFFSDLGGWQCPDGPNTCAPLNSSSSSGGGSGSSSGGNGNVATPTCALEDINSGAVVQTGLSCYDSPCYPAPSPSPRPSTPPSALPWRSSSATNSIPSPSFQNDGSSNALSPGSKNVEDSGKTANGRSMPVSIWPSSLSWF